MKVAILGGGFTGLSAAYYLSKKGYEVTIFEKENKLGGLAVGFKEKNWNWYLERAYHHLFSNDADILNFAKDMGFNDIFFRSPETASLYEVGPEIDYRIIPVDTPQDFLRFPLLSLPVKIRSAAVLAFLKFSPFLSIYEKYSAEEFMRKAQGNRAWEVLWKELFRKKFGKYAGNILTSFMWARITKRTKDLGYVRGGFQEFINATENKVKSMGVSVKAGTQVEDIEKRGRGFIVTYLNHKTISEDFDVVISTLPTPILTKVTGNILPQEYIDRLQKIKYLHAMNLILETKTPLLGKTYWLSICTDSLPMMVVVQHTNFMDKENYGGNHILYIGNYIDTDDKLLKMNKEETLKYFLPYLKKINPNFGEDIINLFHFKAPFAQPIFDKEFVSSVPHFKTPMNNFFIANLDMTYPYDRGTNYAVKLGKDVSELV